MLLFVFFADWPIAGRIGADKGWCSIEVVHARTPLPPRRTSIGFGAAVLCELARLGSRISWRWHQGDCRVCKQEGPGSGLLVFSFVCATPPAGLVVGLVLVVLWLWAQRLVLAVVVCVAGGFVGVL
jgi:hypothetical protein